MEAQKAMWIDLDSIINDYLEESEQPNTKYYKCYHIAYRGMDDLGLDFFYQVKSVRLPINANFTFSLPSDCLQWCKVGYFNSIGQVVPIKYNPQMGNYDAIHPSRMQRLQVALYDAGGYISNVFHNYYDGGTVVHIYGIPGGNYDGMFNIDTHTGIIALDFGFPYQDLVLEYIANPDADSGNCRVPVQFREALISWLWWKDGLASSKRGSIGTAAQRRSQYFNDRRLGRARYKPVRLDQAYIYSLETQRIAVKM